MSNLETFIHTTAAIIVIMIMSRLVGSAMRYIRQPRVVGEMIAGVLLGPTLLASLQPALSDYLFKDTQPQIYMLGNLGLSFYMFLVGMEIDFGKVDSKLQKQAGILSFVASVVPFGAGCYCAFIYYEKLSLPGMSVNSFMFYMGTAFSIMAFPMLARILDEKNLIKTRIGSLSLLSASIQDVVTWILLAFVTALASSGTFQAGFITLVGAMLFVAAVFFLLKPYLHKLGKKIQDQGSITQNQLTIILICLLMSALVTDKVGLYSVFGGFILGLAIPRDNVIQSGIKSRLQDITTLVLLPLFFAFSGLKTNFLVLFSPEFIVPSLVILVLSVTGKYLPVLLSMRMTGYSWRQSSAIGALINARGLMELIVANIGLDYKLINTNTYSILVLMAVLTTLSAMPVYNLSMRGERVS